MRKRTIGALHVVGCLALSALGACERNVLYEAPEELLGTWVTNAPAYENRAFKIDSTQITLFRGEAGLITHHVERIESQKFEGGVQYRFHHRTESGQLDIFQVDHTAFPGDFLRIKNRPRIAWHRDTTGGAGS